MKAEPDFMGQHDEKAVKRGIIHAENEKKKPKVKLN